MRLRCETLEKRSRLLLHDCSSAASSVNTPLHSYMHVYEQYVVLARLHAEVIAEATCGPRRTQYVPYDLEMGLI